jgi:hypothetical protein
MNIFRRLYNKFFKKKSKPLTMEQAIDKLKALHNSLEDRKLYMEEINDYTKQEKKAELTPLELKMCAVSMLAIRRYVSSLNIIRRPPRREFL